VLGLGLGLRLRLGLGLGSGLGLGLGLGSLSRDKATERSLISRCWRHCEQTNKGRTSEDNLFRFLLPSFV
jgi:hypothetical protein